MKNFIALGSFLLLGLDLWAPSSAQAKDACSVFTAADAEAAIGEPVGAPKSESRPSPQGEGSNCKFRAAQGSALKAKSVSVTLQQTSSDVSRSEGGIETNLKSAGMSNVHPVSGVGDSAVWGTMSIMGKPMDELTVLKGKSTMLIIIINGITDEPTALDRAKTLALKVLPKL